MTQFVVCLLVDEVTRKKGERDVTEGAPLGRQTVNHWTALWMTQICESEYLGAEHLEQATVGVSIRFRHLVLR